MNTAEIITGLQNITAYINEFKNDPENEIQVKLRRAQKALDELDWTLKALTVSRRQQRDAQEKIADSAALVTSQAQTAQNASSALPSQEDDEVYLNQTQAAEWLSIDSETTLRLIVYREGLRHKFEGDRMWIPLSELERIEYSEAVRKTRESDRAFHKMAALGDSDEPLTQEEMDMISASRPGRPPWKR